MSVPAFVNVTAEELDVAAALAYCDAPGHGAAAVFVGRVRNLNEGQPVHAVTYDVHPVLCRQVFTEITNEAASQWGEDARLWLEHRSGRLEVGEASVVAAVSTPHRRATFEALHYLVEGMKHRAPVWKREHYDAGDSTWLPGHPLTPTP